MSSRGGTASGVSSEQVVTSISSGKSRDEKVSCVPQRGQKVLDARSDEANDVGTPESNDSERLGTVNQVR